MKYESLITLLKGHRVFLQTHNFPDPDALASAYGLQQFLLHFDIPSTICYDGKIDKVGIKRIFQTFHIHALEKTEITDMATTDYIVTVDGQKYNANFTDLIGDEVACIDHHPTYIACEYHYSDIRITGACSSIVTSYFRDAGITPDENTASLLLYGLRMDTASFTRGTTDFDIEMFRFLNPLANHEKLQTLYHSTLELTDLKAYGAAIENIKVYDDFGFVYIPFDCDDALIAMISDFTLSLDIVRISVVYALRNGGLKFSVRSELPKIHAGNLIKTALTNYGNGGGHASMSGGVVPEENLRLLGRYKELTIQHLFTNALEQMKKRN